MDTQATQTNSGDAQAGPALQPGQTTASGGATATPAQPTLTQADIDRAVSTALSKAGRETKTLEEREKAVKAREEAAGAAQYEITVFNIARENKMDPASLKEAATELGLTTPEQLTALARRLGGTPSLAPALKPDSGKTVGGGPDTSRMNSGDYFEAGLKKLREKK
jgi:hypothetical protein